MQINSEAFASFRVFVSRPRKFRFISPDSARIRFVETDVATPLETVQTFIPSLSFSRSFSSRANKGELFD